MNLTFWICQIYHIPSLSKAYWTHNKHESHFQYDSYFTNKTIITKLFEFGKDIDGKNEILVWRRTLLKKVKDHNVTDPKKKKNFIKPMSILESLADFKLADDDSYGGFFLYQKMRT